MMAPIVWITGISGSGKTHLAVALLRELRMLSVPAILLDGDELRAGLSADVAFDNKGRTEAVRRAAHVAQLVSQGRAIPIVSMISPYAEGRRSARSICAGARFIEVYMDTPLEVAESRDIKGLYAQARAGVVEHFTGISSPYERPKEPDVVIPHGMSTERATRLLLAATGCLK